MSLAQNIARTIALGAVMLSGFSARTLAQPVSPIDRLTDLASEEHEKPLNAFELGFGSTPSSDLIGPEDVEAHRPLEVIRVSLQAALTPDPVATEEISPEARHAATTRYVEARSRLNNGDTAAGIAMLEEAAALDPTSGTILAELGLARVRAGRTQTGLAVLHRAVELGDRNPGTLYTLARLRIDRAEPALALPLLFKAQEGIGPGTDPALPALISASLGLALLEQGSVLAGAEALAESLRHPTRLRSTTQHLADYGAWVRQRKNLLDRGAESFWRVGEVNRAAELYAMADDSGSFNPDDLLTRLVAAHAASGHPASAALTILDTISTLQRPTTDRQARLLRILSNEADLGSTLAAAFEQIESTAAQAPPSLRSGLVLARSACLSKSKALALLRESCHEPWATRELVRRWLLAESSSKSVARHAESIVEARPEQARVISDLLALTRSDSHAIFESLQSRKTPAGRLMATRLALWAHRPDLAEDSEGALGSTLIAHHLAAAQAVTAATQGEWESYADQLERLEKLESMPPVILAEALRGGQRFDEALALLAEAPRDLEVLRAEASILRTLGRLDEAAATLEQAIRLDPTDEWLHTELIGVLTSGPQDEGELSNTLRRIRERLPSGRLIRQLMAQNLVQSGLLNQAERWLEDLLADGAPIDDIIPLLAASWNAKLGQNAAPESIAPIIEQLREFHKQTPGSLRTVTTLAGLLAARGDRDEALRVLEQTHEARFGSRESAKAIEQLLRGALNRGDESTRRAQARLDRSALGIDNSLELVGRMITEGVSQLPAAFELVAGAIPESAQLTPRQRVTLAGLQDRAVALALSSPSDTASAIAAAGLADLALSNAVILSPMQHERLIQLLAGSQELGRVLRACAVCIEQHPALSQAAWLLGGQSLERAGRFDDSVALLSEALAEIGEPIDLPVLSQLVQTASSRGSTQSVRAMIDRLEEAGLTARVGELIAASYPFMMGSVPPGSLPERFRAELAYLISLQASTYDRMTQADELLELAIEFDPTHPWAANDLGYKIAESGEQLDHAEKLLVTAAAALPDRGSVLDSLGWLRYKLGVFDDDGQTEGAVTLLTRASQQADGQTNATIFLHLGDSLWRLKKPKLALEAWAEALVLSQEQLQLALRNRVQARITNEFNQELRAILARISAANEDTPPPISPIPGIDP